MLLLGRTISAPRKIAVNVLPQRCYRFEADIGWYAPLYNRKRTSVF